MRAESNSFAWQPNVTTFTLGMADSSGNGGRTSEQPQSVPRSTMNDPLTGGISRGDRRPSVEARPRAAPALPCRSGRSVCGSAYGTGTPAEGEWDWADRPPG